MKKIGFIGAFDKIDIIIYISKILQSLNYKVLVIDATISQKTKFIVPTINPTKSYITDFEDIEFAVGFKNWEDIEKYLGIKYDISEDNKDVSKEERKIDYDFVLIDVDNRDAFEKFGIQKNETNYFVTGFDSYSVKRGLNIFEDLNVPIKLTKILFSYQQTRDEEEYLNIISLEYNINWSEYTFYFPIFVEDIKVIQENQRIEQIRFRKLSSNYKESLAYVAQDINKQANLSKIKKVMKD